MRDDVKAVIGIAVIIIFFMALYCVYLHLCRWCVEDHLKHKTGMANYYEEKYRSLKTRHEYLKRSSARIARLYKIHKDKYK